MVCTHSTDLIYPNTSYCLSLVSSDNATVLCPDHPPSQLGLDHTSGRSLLFAAPRIVGVVFIQATALQHFYTSSSISSPPSPKSLLSSTDHSSASMVSSPRNPFLDDSASDSTAAEPLLFPSPKSMPATHNLFDALARSLNNDNDGLMPPPPPRYRASSYTGSSMTPATPMTVPPSPSSPSKRARKRARVEHADRYDAFRIRRPLLFITRS